MKVEKLFSWRLSTSKRSMGAGASTSRPRVARAYDPRPVPSYVTPDDGLDDDIDDDQGVRCPITCEIMREPVICADGHSYEKGAIEAWLQANDLSPLTGQKLAHKHLVPNHALKSIIEERRERSKARGGAGAASSSNLEAGARPSLSEMTGDGATWKIHPSRLELEGPARLRQMHLTTVLLDQRLAELGLQQLEMARDRRQRGIKHLRRPRKAAGLGQSDKAA